MTEDNTELQLALKEFYDTKEGSPEEDRAFLTMLRSARDLEDLECIYERGLNSRCLTGDRPRLMMLLAMTDLMLARASA